MGQQCHSFVLVQTPQRERGECHNGGGQITWCDPQQVMPLRKGVGYDVQAVSPDPPQPHTKL